MGKDVTKYYLAIDIGASSGRHILGSIINGQLCTQEVYRFATGFVSVNGSLVNDIDKLTDNVIKGIKLAFEIQPNIESLSIDTWGVDYVLMRGDSPVLPVYAYRDSRTLNVIDEVHSKISFDDLYKITGIQFQPFNTIYQLYADKIAGRLEGVSDYLMLPEYLSYVLTGIKKKEYTAATTTGIVNTDKSFDSRIIKALGLPNHLFKPLDMPGTIVGTLRDEIVENVGGNCKVVLCASHDTGSAVEGVSIPNKSLYLSSGTWSLLGVKLPEAITDKNSQIANFSNEGGVGYYRYQKNIMGMWVVNKLKEEIAPTAAFSDIVEWAKLSNFIETVDVDEPEFFAPESMKAVFDKKLSTLPSSIGDYFRVAFSSLAKCYAKAVNEIKVNTGFSYDSLYIVGGGAKNDFLNELTAKETGMNVVPLPIEATAIGNLKVQMEA